MRKTAILTMILISTCFAASLSAQVTDEFTGQTLTLMEDQVAVLGFKDALLDPMSRSAYLKLGKIEQPGMETIYAISIYLSGKRYLFQDHLFVKVGDEVFESEAKTKNRDYGNGSATESSLYPVTAEQLRSMASGDSIKIRIRGSRGQVENAIKKKGLAKIRAWVETHVTAG